MSFSHEVKKELTSLDMLPACCQLAQAYGLVLFAHFSTYDISLTSESSAACNAYSEWMNTVCNVRPTAETNGSKKITLSVGKSADRKKVYDVFGHSERELKLRINRSNISEDCCSGAFIRGVFLACGSVTDPNKNYHLEFVVSHEKLCSDLETLLRECGFSPKRMLRNDYYVVYFKDSESIEDLLTFMGATMSSLEIMGVKMQKDVVNRVNRRVNFEMSNLNKTIDAATRQVEAIELIRDTRGLDYLPDNLREIAQLRIENPEISLKELGSMLSVPISRSGVNHRLTRILEMAEDLKDSATKD